ncbi:hypothetical protein AB0K08_16015 [Citricoccus sp. NPDC055426]|uniref:hypothetical protein n=1 Tax=Citricoccus sp. NPDC055426 TaxID=3155536 RepID=UPI003442F973
MTAEPLTSPEQAQEKPPWSLWKVALIGFFFSCLALLLAIWYFAYQATMDRPTVWWWFPALSQDDMFRVIRNAVTAVAALGVGVTLFLSYRRQHVAERALQLSAEAQLQATETLELSAKTYELTRQQQVAEFENQLRNRYSTAAQQIGEDRPSLVIAGCISMATIADEWHRLERYADRDDCIRMLIAALPEGPWDDSGNHLQRSTIQTIFQERMSPDTHRASWSSAPILFGTTRAPFGRIVDWTINRLVKIDSAQLSLGNETPVIQSIRVQGGSLEVTMNSTKMDYMVFAALALHGAQLRLRFWMPPAVNQTSKVVFKNSLFDASLIRIDEPNTPPLARQIVFEKCTFASRTIQVPRDSMNYLFTFQDCRFAANPFKPVDRTRSPEVGIQFAGKNTFIGPMNRFPADSPAAMLDTASWFFPEGKPRHSGKR